MVRRERGTELGEEMHESGGDGVCKAAATVPVASSIRCPSLFLLGLVCCWHFLRSKETKLQGCQQQDMPTSLRSWSLPVLPQLGRAAEIPIFSLGDEPSRLCRIKPVVLYFSSSTSCVQFLPGQSLPFSSGFNLEHPAQLLG